MIDNFAPPPKSPGQNTGQLFGGLGLQAVGAGILAGSTYLIVISPEEEADIWIYGMTIGAGLFVVGSGLIIRSIKNMVITRKSIHDFKKKRGQGEISLNLESTSYGVGIVFRF